MGRLLALGAPPPPFVPREDRAFLASLTLSRATAAEADGGPGVGAGTGVGEGEGAGLGNVRLTPMQMKALHVVGEQGELGRATTASEQQPHLQ